MYTGKLAIPELLTAQSQGKMNVKPGDDHGARGSTEFLALIGLTMASAVPLGPAAITEEARRVLEQFLKRSLSANDASPVQQEFQAITEVEVTEEVISEDQLDSSLPDQDKDQYLVNYVQSGGFKTISEGDIVNLVTSSPEVEEKVEEYRSYAPSSTGTSNAGTLPRKKPGQLPAFLHNDAGGFKVNYQCEILDKSSPESEDKQGMRSQPLSSTGTSTAGTLPRKKKSGHVADNSSESSDSDDSHYKKKKSFFKKAKERFRESFRRSHSRSKSVDSDPDYSSLPRKHKKKFKRKYKSQENGNFVKPESDHSRSNGSKSSDKSKDGFCEIHTHTHTHVDQFNRPICADGCGTVLHIERTHQTTDIHREGSPDRHIDINVTLKESHPSTRKLKDDKTLLETIRRLLRRNSSHKKKKKDMPVRSKSADSIQTHGVHHSQAIPIPDAAQQTIYCSLPRRSTTRVTHQHIRPAAPPGVNTSSKWQKQEIETTLTRASQILSNKTGIAGRTTGLSIQDKKGKFRLDGVVLHRPDLPATDKAYRLDYVTDRTDKFSKTLSGHFKVNSTVEEERVELTTVDSDGDMTDGLAPTIVISDSSVTEIARKPFQQRSEAEKEKLYGVIADKLNAIAENYNITAGSPVDKTKPLEPPVPRRSPSPRVAKDSVDALEKELAECLRLKGDTIVDKYPEAKPAVTNLALGATYDEFSRVVNRHMKDEPSLHQLAFFFTAARSAVTLAGAGGALAVQVKEMALRFFEDKFANWIISKGGWESMMEDFDSTTDPDFDSVDDID